jgi:hypothetical protein
MSAVADARASITPAEVELVADFNQASATVCAAFRCGRPHHHSRKVHVPSTLASIERRWFVGKQTKRSADNLAAKLVGVSTL